MAVDTFYSCLKTMKFMQVVRKRWNRGHEVLGLFKTMVKARVMVDSVHYKAISELDNFKNLWCFSHAALCSVGEGEHYVSDGIQ